MDIPRRSQPTPFASLRRAAAAHRTSIRWTAIIATTVSAVVYLLIGLEAVMVVENPADQASFGLMAATGYAVATLALIAIRRRWLYLTGAAMQALVMWMYFTLAAERTPAFEFWGVFLRVPQTILLAALVLLALAWHPATRRLPRTGSTRPRNAKPHLEGP